MWHFFYELLRTIFEIFKLLSFVFIMSIVASYFGKLSLCIAFGHLPFSWCSFNSSCVLLAFWFHNLGMGGFAFSFSEPECVLVVLNIVNFLQFFKRNLIAKYQKKLWSHLWTVKQVWNILVSRAQNGLIVLLIFLLQNQFSGNI